MKTNKNVREEFEEEFMDKHNSALYWMVESWYEELSEQEREEYIEETFRDIWQFIQSAIKEAVEEERERIEEESEMMLKVHPDWHKHNHEVLLEIIEELSQQKDEK